MSHLWHKSLRVVVSAGIAVGVVGLTLPAVSAKNVHAVRPALKGGLVTFSDNQFPDSLNPVQESTVVSVEQIALVQPTGNTLTITPTGGVKYLEINPPKSTKNHLTYTFSLIPNMTWSNGDKVTNKDFKFGWNVYMNPNASACVTTCDNIASISLKGKLGIVVHMVGLYAPAIINAIGAVPLLDHSWHLAGKVTTADLTNCLNTGPPNFSGCDNYSTAFAGDTTVNYEDSGFDTLGPYKVKDFFSSEIDYNANPNYTKNMPGGVPHIKNIKFLFYTDVASEIAGAAAHQTDTTEDYFLSNVDTLNSYSSKFKTLIGGGGNPEVITFNQRNANPCIDSLLADCGAAGAQTNPFLGSNGEKVRHALLLGFNYTKLIQAAYGPINATDAAKLVSFCAPIRCDNTGHPLPYSDGGTVTGVYDPKANGGAGGYVPGRCGTDPGNGGDGQGNTAVQDAEALLEDAGYSHTNKLVVWVSSTTAAARQLEMQYLQGCWNALSDGVGSMVTANYSRVKSVHYFASYGNDGTLAKGRFEADIHAYGGIIPDPDSWKANFESSRCPQDPPFAATAQNIDCFADPTIDTDLNKAGSSFVKGVRTKYYHLFVEEVAKQGDWGVIAPRPEIWTYDGKPKHGFAMNQWLSEMTWNAFQWR